MTRWLSPLPPGGSLRGIRRPSLRLAAHGAGVAYPLPRHAVLLNPGHQGSENCSCLSHISGLTINFWAIGACTRGSNRFDPHHLLNAAEWYLPPHAIVEHPNQEGDMCKWWNCGGAELIVKFVDGGDI